MSTAMIFSLVKLTFVVEEVKLHVVRQTHCSESNQLTFHSLGVRETLEQG